ncbi:MAG: LppP/LprE family lipoprotein [Acidobacteriaceae bacterium]
MGKWKWCAGVLLMCSAAFAQSLPSLPGNSLNAQSLPWLDKPLTDWNARTQAIPLPPPNDDKSESIWQFCDRDQRRASTPEDLEVQEKHWHLFGEVHLYGKLSVVSAMSDADGMCRPLGYQFFVFEGKRFVGTISPVPMDSRSDGALDRVILTGENTLVAQFRRYTPDDPLCCPSATSTVQYEVVGDESHAHLVAKAVSTTSNVQGK